MEEKKNHKLSYILWMTVSFILFVLSLLDGSIRGPKLWAIATCMGIATCFSALKLRNLLHGKGWVFPGTNSVLLWVVPFEAVLYLWFSH